MCCRVGSRSGVRLPTMDRSRFKRGQRYFRLEAFHARESVSRDKRIPSSLGLGDCFKITRSQFWNGREDLRTSKSFRAQGLRM